MSRKARNLLLEHEREIREFYKALGIGDEVTERAIRAAQTLPAGPVMDRANNRALVEAVSRLGPPRSR